MKILVLGGDGMLGHQLLLSLQDKHNIKVTLRQDFSAYRSYELFNQNNAYFNVDAQHQDNLLEILTNFRPEAVINAIGLVKQRKTSYEIIPSLEINALLPHRLALMCKAIEARLIHISTDCVFNGKKGKYTEDDLSDAEDLYGRSKYLGEVHDINCVTLRTSIIGLELARKSSLIEWFLAQKGSIKGFKHAIYTGLTTVEISRIIEKILLQYTELSGLWHVSSAPISKYDLLSMFSKLLNRTDIKIDIDTDFTCDRSLISERFKKETCYQSPTWNEMLHELVHQVRQREKKSYDFYR